MSFEVVPFPVADSVIRLWDAYAMLARQCGTNPALLSDMSYMQQMAKAHEVWRASYLESKK